jgi:hypothetical protein
MTNRCINYGYYAVGYFWVGGDLERIDTSNQFPSNLGLFEIADRAKLWALNTPGVEAYKLHRRPPGQHTGKPVGCMMILVADTRRFA